MPDQAYHEGDFYQCVTATAVTESPTTAPSKWRRIALPKDWRWVLGQMAHAHLLEMDGQMDKAAAVRAMATEAESRGLDAQVRRAANRERHLHRPNVSTPQYRRC